VSETALAKKRCAVCNADTPPIAPAEAQRLLAEIPGWSLMNGGKALHMERRFANFMAVVGFINRLAPVVEAEDHHPDIRIFSYRWLALDYSTHAIGALTENDFIMAAKVNELLANA
jgi:4a-hydroxytetrahydrobiopterin dehydratase